MLWLCTNIRFYYLEYNPDNSFYNFAVFYVDSPESYNKVEK